MQALRAPGGQIPDPGDFLRALFAAAVAAADPRLCLPPILPPPLVAGRTCVIAIGKAAAGMALAARRAYGRGTGGLVVVPHGMPVDVQALGPGFEVIHAAHPVPDADSERAGRRALALAGALGPQDRLLALISGGGSALAEVPLAGVSLADIRAMTAALLASGAPIEQINAVRRALSRFKGGGLAAAAWPAEVATCIISDVPCGDPATVASGPTVPGPEDDQAIALLRHYRIEVPATVQAALQRTRAARARFGPDSNRIAAATLGLAASGATALAAAARSAAQAGVAVLNLGDRLQGPARDLASAHAAQALAMAGAGPAQAGPQLIMSGGELSVAVSAPPGTRGRGGRNLTYLLELAIALAGRPGIHAIACDTDGLDGTSPAAGAVIGPTTLARARACGLDPAACLKASDSHRFFETLGDLVVTGQTGTNVNDFRAILIEPRQVGRKAEIPSARTAPAGHPSPDGQR